MSNKSFQEMRRTMIPVLLLATVALSTGVVLSHLQPLQSGPDPVSDQDSDSHGPLTECEVLRKLFRSKSNWAEDDHPTWKMLGYDTDNNQEDYNEYFNTGQGDDESLKDPWLSYRMQFDRPAGFLRNFFYHLYPYTSEAAPKPVYKRSLPNMKMLYVRNNDFLIRDDNAYYVYDTYMATTNPFDYKQNRYNCLHKTMTLPSSHDEPPTDADNLELQEKRERLDPNEITPLTKQVMDKRYDALPETGEKEIPDNLYFDEGEKAEVQKKLFSFWSRLQALSHKGRQVPTRRHTFVYYGPDGDTRDGPLTAEIRASHLRPPGQPLRWG